jgi:hypothetical protein
VLPDLPAIHPEQPIPPSVDPPPTDQARDPTDQAKDQTSDSADLWPVGTLVQLRQRPSYLKTADPMPMLRPADLVGVDEVGQVVEQRALGQLAVRFRRGTFLLAAAACAPASA